MPLTQSEESFADKEGLHLQISVVACQAIETGDPDGFLKSNVQYHNAGEYYIHETGPTRYLLLITDDRVEHAIEACKSLGLQHRSAKLEKTVYVAIANRVQHVTGFPAVSLANFYCAQKSCGFELAEGAEAHSLVLQLLDSLPVATLFNFLGQGYKVVLSGHQFGGILAHALASKLLLQVHQEIQTAQQMGINLSALSMTEDKVMSFAFSAPFFANTALQKALAAHNLHSNLNTLWKPNDGSIALLTLCGELARKNQAGSTTINADSLLPHLGTAEFKALQTWAGALADELGKLPRRRNMALACQPLDLANLMKLEALSLHHQHHSSSLTSQGSFRTLSVPAGGDGKSPSPGTPTSTPSKAATPTSSSPAVRRTSLTGSRRSSVNSTAAAVMTATKLSKPPGIKLPSSSTPASPSKPAASPLSAKGRTGAAADDAAAPGSAVAAAAATGGTATAAGAGNDSPTTTSSSTPMPESPTTVASTPTRGGAGWKSSLSALMKFAPSSSAACLAPVGQFWVLKGGPGGKGKEEVTFMALDGATAATTTRRWLSDTNKEMFAMWESGLEELKKELLEAFAWTTFKTGITAGEQLVDRKTLIRAAKGLDIY